MRKKLTLALCILSALVFLGCAGILLHYWQQDRSDARVRAEVAAMRPEETEPDAAFADLLAANPDTIGWLHLRQGDAPGLLGPAQEDQRDGGQDAQQYAQSDPGSALLLIGKKSVGLLQ